MPAAALSLRRLSGLPSLAPARRTSRAAATPVVVTRALFGKNRQSQAQEAAIEQLPPAPVRRFSGGRSNARRSSPRQLVAAPGSGSHAPSLSQRYENASPLARGLIGAAAALALFTVVKKILGGGR